MESFTEFRRLPDIAERFEKVRRHFYLRESTYDMTSRCNVICDGCYYFEGDKQHTKDVVDVEAWRALMRSERDRGITFVVLAGAEPALVPELLQAVAEIMPTGAIATNGLVKIPASVGYRTHVSVWGNDETSERVRKAKRMLERQLENYADDRRAVFVYTFSRSNIEEAYDVVGRIAAAGRQVTFNMFSAPVGYTGELRHDHASLLKVREAMLGLSAQYPQSVLCTPYYALVHTSDKGLHDLFSCPYPRRNPSDEFGLGRTFRQVRTDLQWVREAACCVPDTDCDDCRHYAAGSAVVTARMNRHTNSADEFRAWLDYVDTYLSVWVNGYEKGEPLCRHPATPGESASVLPMA
jgi:organic radical activating enzyme